MQIAFITNLKKIIDAGKNRALLISATGTGKTYASAFAMRELEFYMAVVLLSLNDTVNKNLFGV
ncbi:DEAD/DEAH box helicase family protein [Eshraghiella crossota]|uniref:DEAD/DEAH box helicase family protein n=1 Tax=Eshraghiella crossota TaxID=45851 RepID=UPI003AB26BA5